MTNAEVRPPFPVPRFVIRHSSFVIRHSSPSPLIREIRIIRVIRGSNPWRRRASLWAFELP
jgi:hypothetical protein